MGTRKNLLFFFLFSYISVQSLIFDLFVPDNFRLSLEHVYDRIAKMNSAQQHMLQIERGGRQNIRSIFPDFPSSLIALLKLIFSYCTLPRFSIDSCTR